MNDTEILNWLEANTCDLRCVSVPTGGDDADVLWEVVEHHMPPKGERVIGYGKTPRLAVIDAEKSPEDPTKWDYVPPEAL
jgi:hypothetical protein